jgi:FkbM family methyltransferase
MNISQVDHGWLPYSVRDKRSRLRLLRALTQKGYRIGGPAKVFYELVRLYYIRHPEIIWLHDFDGDLAMQVNLADHIESKTFWRGYYSLEELLVLEKLLRPSDIFFDIGANTGEFTLFAAKRLQSGQVYAFEPASHMYNKLSMHAERNSLSHVHLFKLALADSEGETLLYSPTINFSDGSVHNGIGSLFSGRFRQSTEHQEVIRLTTLDRFVQEHGVPHIDLMKIDVEGAELQVLRGAEQVIRRSLPRIIIEIDKRNIQRSGYDTRDIIRFLHEIAYDLHTISRSGTLIPFDDRNVQEWQNVLCTPRSN